MSGYVTNALSRLNGGARTMSQAETVNAILATGVDTEADLEQLADEIALLDQRAKMHAEGWKDTIIEIGKRLVAARKLLPENEGWNEWCETNVPYTRSHIWKLEQIGSNPALIAPMDNFTIAGALQVISEEKSQKERNHKTEREVQKRMLAAPEPPELPSSVEMKVADCANPLFEGEVDLIVTSPPYGLGIQGVDATDGYAAYKERIWDWARGMYTMARKPSLADPSGGRLAINIPLDTNRDGPKLFHFDWHEILTACGWVYRDIITWREGNVARSTAYGTLNSAKAPNLTNPDECVLIYHAGGEWGRGVDGTSDNTEHVEWSRSSWEIPNRAHPWHPAPFPEELARRLIKLYSYREDTICDPFAGSFTTVMAGYQANRRRVWGFDVREDYVFLAKGDFEKRFGSGIEEVDDWDDDQTHFSDDPYEGVA